MNHRRRASHIAATFARYRLDTLLTPEVLEALDAPWYWRTAQRLNPLNIVSTGGKDTGARLRLALEELGPIFVKLGQLLSTRRDIIPAEIADELALLQDAVAPFDGQTARKIVEQSLDVPMDEAFASFDITPLASASVAQVHPATLVDGTLVVVKVVRPNLMETIGPDLDLLHRVATALERRSEDARRLHLMDIVADYEQTILAELDMSSEARNTIKLRENFAGSPLLYVPRVYHRYTSESVLVLERIEGIPISRMDTLEQLGVDMRVLAERGVETFFTQVFVDNFFHADMHPGNIFVDVSDPADPSYIALDCAIIGTLTEEDQEYLARNLVAFFHRDYEEVARLHLDSGWIPPDVDQTEFEQVIREVCEPIFAKPLAEISFGEFLVELFETAARFHMEIQPQLVLLQKTLLYVEGVGRQLYPQLDLWETAMPFMESWMADRVGVAAALRRLSENAPRLVNELPRLPEFLFRVQADLRAVRASNYTQEKRLAALEAAARDSRARRRRQRIGGGALLAVASVLLWAPLARSLAEDPTLATSIGILAAAIGTVLLARG